MGHFLGVLGALAVWQFRIKAISDQQENSESFIAKLTAER
jgi:hypothetical protein